MTTGKERDARIGSLNKRLRPIAPPVVPQCDLRLDMVVRRRQLDVFSLVAPRQLVVGRADPDRRRIERLLCIGQVLPTTTHVEKTHPNTYPRIRALQAELVKVDLPSKLAD